MEQYATLVEALNGLRKEGYTEDFNLLENCLDAGQFKIFHDEFEVDKYFRFDVASDAADQSILYAISSPKYELKGVLVNSYGTYSDAIADELMDKLKMG